MLQPRRRFDLSATCARFRLDRSHVSGFNRPAIYRSRPTINNTMPRKFPPVAAKFAPPSRAQAASSAVGRADRVRPRPGPNATRVGPMTGRPAIIVAANSARGLASSAKRAGFAPLSIDVFGDDDTRGMSLAAIKLGGGLSDGLTHDKVVGAVETLISAYDPIGLVYGSGFEGQPETIAAIARMTRIFGNEAETLRRAKDPFALARLSAAIGVSHPEIAFAPPDEPERWLVKRRGGAGGAHVTAATGSRPAPPDCYFQRRVAGQNISALFVANGQEAGIIGLSEQWTAPTPASPFRYGGSVGPVGVGAAQAEEIGRAIANITSELGLVG